MPRVLLFLCFVLVGVMSLACGENDGGVSNDDSDSESEEPAIADTATAGYDTESSTDTDTDTDTDSDTDADSDGDLPDVVCTPPISLYDTSTPTTVIGTGTPDSCNETDLRNAAAQGGIITFNCGSEPATIFISETIALPNNLTTVIDGGGLITLDAENSTRHFIFDHPDWMNNPEGVVLQRLTFRGGRAPATEYIEQDTDNPQCAYGYADGSGGVLYVRNGVVHIIECAFYDNEAALIGPDVGGGAIYVVGVPELTISRSVFVGNRGSNGGAVGMLFVGNPGIYNSLFENNSAEGTGQNGCCDTACVGVGHDEQTGAGGNSGAVYLDGLNDEDQVFHICGAVFRGNNANELGGALFRTPNAGVRQMLIEQSVFDSNSATLGGVSFIKDHQLTVRESTFMNNSADNIGGLWVNSGTMDVENCTFYNNSPNGLIVDNASVIRNSTIVDSPLSGTFTVTNSMFAEMSCSSSQAGSNNLQWPEEETSCAEGTVFADPTLGTLGDNGGPTPTFMPGAAVEGIGVGCPATDQRGEPRDITSCAAGAVEP